MLVLGIDPGTATTGYGLVKEHSDGSLQAVTYGVITTPAGRPMWERLNTIFDGIQTLVNTYQPDCCAVEEMFFAKNVTTALTVAQGRGVILLALVKAGIAIKEYKPNVIKQAVAGYGAAKKPQIQEMTRILLGLETVPQPDDAADALAIAITGLHSYRYTGLDE